MNEKNAGAVARRWFEDVWNKRLDGAIEEMMTADSVGHVEGGDVIGSAGFRQMQAGFVSAFPDLRIEVEDVLSEGERAAVRWRVTGTHEGPGMGMAATQRKIDARGTTWLIVRDGRIVEGWDTWNMSGMMQSLQ